LAGEGEDIGRQIHAARFPASMSAVAMAAAAAATAAASAAGFFARTGVVAGTGGGEGRKFLVELAGSAVRAFRAAPLGGANEDFGIAFALGAMVFIDRHGWKIAGAAGMFK